MSGTALPWLQRLAHDLRGPLMPLQTAAYLLRSGQVDGARQQELFEVVDRQTRRLARMIDELGDWSRATDGNLLGPCEACEAALLLDNAIDGARLSAAPAINDHSLQARVHGDQQRLTQLLRTLLEYAARRQPAQVCMRVADGQLQVDVVDCDGGVDVAQMAALFEQPMPEPFDEGLGLRLLIARAIAEAHAGSLHAEPADNGGVRLRVRLPLAA